MPFVVAFIAFNILDLDGSNLASLTRSFDRFVIDAEVGAATSIDPLPERSESFENDHRLVMLDDSSDRARYNTLNCARFRASKKPADIFITLACRAIPCLADLHCLLEYLFVS